MCGHDTGNSPVMPYGLLHANEAEIMVKYGGYSSMEAIVACTKDNAFSVGLENDLGVIEAGKLADIIVLDKDPVADVSVLQAGRHLPWVIKDGKIVYLDPNGDGEETDLAARQNLEAAVRMEEGVAVLVAADRCSVRPHSPERVLQVDARG